VESPRVTADIVEATEFPELARRYNVYAVPKIVINDTHEFVGALPEPHFITALARAVTGDGGAIGRPGFQPAGDGYAQRREGVADLAGALLEVQQAMQAAVPASSRDLQVVEPGEDLDLRMGEGVAEPGLLVQERHDDPLGPLVDQTARHLWDGHNRVLPVSGSMPALRGA